MGRSLEAGPSGSGRRLRIGRPVRVVAPAGLTCPKPGQLGLVWPTLMVPASLLTGLPPEELHAVLAHELAHPAA